MTASIANPAKAFTFVALGLALAALGIYLGEADDAPGAAVMGMLLMVAGVVLGVRAARNRLPAWAARTALAVGVLVAAFAAFITHTVVVRAALFPQSVPSAAGPAACCRGASVAVGTGGSLAWAEGFGWRDVVTQAPVTTSTRFNIGTAASAVRPAVATLGLTNTGSDPAAVWSPEHVGEPEEDFPLFTLIRNVIARPMGFAEAQPLPGERATFYVPRSDDDPGRGRRLMYMRDLACCADGMAFYSTPSDLVRFALATNAGSIDGTLAGGMVMSLARSGDNGVVVAVTSNIAFAHTSALARQIAEAFAQPAR